MTLKAVKIGDICELKYGKSLPEERRVSGGFVVFGSNGPVGTHEVAQTNGPAVVIG